MDSPRELLAATLARRPDLDLRTLSLTIGCNHAYLHQYLMRGTPRELPDSVRQALAPLLGVPADALCAASPPLTTETAEADTQGTAARDDRHELPVYVLAEPTARP
ncbi:hypothetical protein [Reyranella sp.]|uniref:hypothetical protein n=1 Tax=Reyranella sp. TaxID=1929291 RepID=UPI003BA8D0D4